MEAVSNCVQATRGCAVLFILAQVSGAPEAERCYAPMKDRSAKEEWLDDISWNWSGPSKTHGKAGSRRKFQSLTLTMTHNPTHMSVVRSTPFIRNKPREVAAASRKLWSELLRELQAQLPGL